MVTIGRISRRHMLAGGAAMIMAGTGGRGLAAAASLRGLDILTFPGAYNLVVWVAMEEGWFAAEGLEVTRTPPGTSQELVAGVVSGRFPVGSSSLDNVVAYNAGQGALHFEHPPGLFSFLNVERNLVLPLVVRPGIERVEDLRGRTLAVDAVGTGFSFVLREILRVHGLGPDDYELAAVGNARARLAALERGEYAGAVLNAPFDTAAVAAGLKVIASSRDAFADYQGTTFITTRAWASAHEAELVGFIKALLRAMRWIRDPANAEAAADLLLRRMAGLDARRAARAVAALARNLTPDFNRAGIETVLALRRRYGTPPAELGKAADHVETRYLAAARAALPAAEEG